MIKLAREYESDLNKLFLNYINTNKDSFFYNSWIDLNTISDTENNHNYYGCDYVSESNGILNGYFSYDIDNVCGYITTVCIILFNESIVGKRDLYTFFKEMYYSKRYYKIKWFVNIGNPVEKLYDKIIKKYNGRIVGTELYDMRLLNGKFTHRKYYELITPYGVEFLKLQHNMNNVIEYDLIGDLK